MALHDEFDLPTVEQSAEPFDLGGLMGGDALPAGQATPPAALPPGGTRKGDWAQLAPLAALIPAILAKGGQAGLAAFLQGMQQAQAQRQQQGQQQFQNERLVAGDQRADAQMQQAAQYRRQVLAQQQQGHQQALMKEFAAALGTIENPDVVPALLEYYSPRAQALGMSPETLSNFALRTATPSALIARHVSRVTKAMPPEALASMLETQASLRVGGKDLPYDMWSQYVAHGVDAEGRPVITAKKLDVPNTPEERLANAIKRGDTAEVERIRRSAEILSGARRQTADPEIAILRKDLLRLQVENAGEEKDPNQAQYTAAGYASRMEQAESTLAPLDQTISGMNWASFEGQVKLPAAAQSATMQSYMQAARNFINAVLRRESGAVISPSEFAEARQQYLPQPGDAPDVLAQKKANRHLVFTTLRRAAGQAYEPPLGTAGTAPPAPATNPFRRRPNATSR